MPGRLRSIAFTLVFIGALETLRIASGASTEVFPPLLGVARTLVALPADPLFWTMLAETLAAWLVSLGIAVSIGVPIGYAMGRNAFARAIFAAPVEFLRPIPSVAMIPLAVVLWGAGFESKLFLAIFASTWPLLYQARYGASSIDRVLHQTARMYGLGALGGLRHVVLPSIAPFVATGVRLAASIALILVITAELLIGGGGLGGGIEFARLGLDLTRFYALMIVTGLIGWAMSGVLGRLERRLLFWHPSHREMHT